jgi:general secretion pathway protein M
MAPQRERVGRAGRHGAACECVDRLRAGTATQRERAGRLRADAEVRVSALAARWQALAPRERGMLALGAVFVLGVLVWLLAWEPLAQSRDALRLQVQAGETDLAWMRAAAPLVRERAAASPAPLVKDGRSLLARADASAREAGLGNALLRVEPVSDGQVRVQFQGAGFDALMRWVEALSAQGGVRVNEFSARRAEGVGLVDANLSLEEPETR